MHLLEIKDFETGQRNGRKSVIAEEIVEEEETRYKITGIIGSKDGLGVECLKGSQWAREVSFVAVRFFFCFFYL